MLHSRAAGPCALLHIECVACFPITSAEYTGGGLTQRLCCPMEDVRPVASSWPCLNTLDRAKPRPSSRMDLVSTPTMVDLPESTFPITATRISMEQAPSVACLRARMSVLSPPAGKVMLKACQGSFTEVVLCGCQPLVQISSGVQIGLI